MGSMALAQKYSRPKMTDIYIYIYVDDIDPHLHPI